MEEAKKEVAARVNFPKGVYAVFGGNAEAAAQAQQELLIHSAIAAAGILLLLIVVTRNWRNLLLVLANVPFAMVGGVLAIWATTKFGPPGANALTIGSLVGFVTLFGITMRNSIMMVSHFEHLVNVEGVAWGPAAAIRGASERVVPILMTALVTALGLLPLALGTGEAGQEIEGPMAHGHSGRPDHFHFVEPAHPADPRPALRQIWRAKIERGVKHPKRLKVCGGERARHEYPARLVQSSS